MTAFAAGSDGGRLRRAAATLAGFVAIAIAAAVAGCGTPTSATSGLTQGGQQCEVCRLQNPGDNAACYAVCLPPIEDLSAGKGSHP